MATTETNILNRLYFVSGSLFVFALAVVFKLCSIQFIQGDAYRELAEKRTVKDFEIPCCCILGANFIVNSGVTLNFSETVDVVDEDRYTMMET